MMSNETKKYIEDAFTDFNFVEKISSETIEKYRGRVPEEMIYIWQKYGCGEFCKGYLRVVNPDEYNEILYATTIGFDGMIVLFATAFADLIIWEDNRISCLLYRYTVLKPMFKKISRVFQFLQEAIILEDCLMWSPYVEALKRFGKPRYKECFAYVPLLSLGGAEKVDNLEIVQLKEHLYILSHIQGKHVFLRSRD